MDPAARVELEAMEFLKPIDEATEPGDSDVQRFYQDAVVFVTGGTGFIGKQLLEKLFRSCNLKKAFVLIRPKKSKPTKDRLHEMFSDPVFEPVRTKKPDLMSRIVSVDGDVADIRLGINNDDWNTIVEEVDIIFHVAATTNFNEKLRTATSINVRGTRETLRLARACKRLRSFVYVSTAYSHATDDRSGNEVREQFYRSPMPAQTLLNLVETVDEKRLDTLTQHLITGWPNTYTFTKAVAEELVQAESGHLPVCVVRPSVVICSYREPLPGWLEPSCVYGGSGVLLGVAMGVVRVIFFDRNSKISFVPVDFVNNAIIVAGYHTGLRGLQEPLLYNVSSSRCGITFNHLYVPVNTFYPSLVSPFALWYFFVINTNNRMVYWFYSWLLHYIPAYIIDAILHIFKVKKPRGLKSAVNIYTKFDKLSATLSYFGTNEWYLNDTNIQNLWQNLSSTDKTIFNFDINSVNWDKYFILFTIGTRKYIIKDGLKDTEKAIAKQKWLKLAHYSVILSYVMVFGGVMAAFNNFVVKFHSLLRRRPSSSSGRLAALM